MLTLLGLKHGIQTADKLKWIKHSNSLKKKYFKDEIWNFNGIRLPDYKPDPTGWLMYSIYMDTLFVFCNHKDDYNCILIDKLDNYLIDGTYGYKNNNIDVTVKKNDIVIDAGAWIGDFSAYAAFKGAKVYAFEPCKNTIEYLKKTEELNQNIQIIEKGLGDKNCKSYLSNNNSNSVSNKITENSVDSEVIEIITLDDFVTENNIEKIDFIKADIEGYERYMLLGATEVLKKLCPKLAICTYHFPDDPEVLARIILEANPNYKIVQKRKKLYAMVKS